MLRVCVLYTTAYIIYTHTNTYSIYPGINLAKKKKVRIHSRKTKANYKRHLKIKNWSGLEKVAMFLEEKL